MHLGSNDKVAMFDYTRMLDKRMIDEGIIAFTGPQWTSHIQLPVATAFVRSSVSGVVPLAPFFIKAYE